MINYLKLTEEKRLLIQTFGSNQPIVLSNPFSNQGSKMVLGTSQTPSKGETKHIPTMKLIC